MRTFTCFSFALVLILSSHTVVADDRSDLLKLKNTTMNLIEALVNEGILSRERADQLIREAEASARVEVETEERKVTEDKSVVRVPYVPEFVRDEIKDEVRSELREAVVNDVMSQAKNERWGIPGALPEWISRIKLKGDIRLRAQGDLFADKNIANSYPNFREINDSGGIAQAGDEAFLNTTKNRYRLRTRMRLGVDAKISNDLKAGIRLATGNRDDPVSTNQTLGTYGKRWEIGVDRAFLRYNRVNADNYNWLTLQGGRFANPFFTTDLVWDKDLSFDGVTATLRYGLGGADSLLDIDEKNRTLFLNMGAFPVQEVDISSSDKWLFGVQSGYEQLFQNQSTFKIGLGYYNYWNIGGKQNRPNSDKYDFTAPEFVQKGNTLFNIADPANPTKQLFALASDYNLIVATARLDLANFSPTHVILTTEYVRNIGYDEDNVSERTGLDVSGETDGYQVTLLVGWPKIRKYRDWRVSASWKHLERDAVIDGFADSDFHLGGTDTEGWILRGAYGLNENTWLQARWLSTDEISGPALGIDTIQLDLNSRF